MSGAELLTTLLKTISDTVLIIDKANRVSFCGGGSQWVQLQALRGRRFDQMFTEEIANLFTTLCEQVRSGETVTQTEIQLKPDNAPALAQLGLKQPQWYRVSCESMQGQVIVALHDITRLKEIEQRVQNQAQRDPITGAYNRKSLVPVLNQAVAQAQRYEYHCSLALMDIDGFKQINEDHGWDAGDSVLRKLVAELEMMKRDSDFLVRIGGDRLALMLPETALEQSLAVGHRVLALVEDTRFEWAGKPIRFGMSVGTSTLNGTMDNAQEMIRRASENLLIAKHSGGNRVETDQY